MVRHLLGQAGACFGEQRQRGQGAQEDGGGGKIRPTVFRVHMLPSVVADFALFTLAGGPFLQLPNLHMEAYYYSRMPSLSLAFFLPAFFLSLT